MVHHESSAKAPTSRGGVKIKNPFDLAHMGEGIYKSKIEGNLRGEDFWTFSERLFSTAFVSFITLMFYFFFLHFRLGRPIKNQWDLLLRKHTGHSLSHPWPDPISFNRALALFCDPVWEKESSFLYKNVWYLTSPEGSDDYQPLMSAGWNGTPTSQVDSLAFLFLRNSCNSLHNGNKRENCRVSLTYVFPQTLTSCTKGCELLQLTSCGGTTVWVFPPSILSSSR